MLEPRSVLSRELLPASTAIYTMVALAAFESLAVAAALPDLASDLGALELLPWVITAYLLLSGIGAVVAGPLIDAVGVRRMFGLAVIVFMAGSAAAAFAPSMPVLIAARVVQGAGSGVLLAVGLAAVNLIYPPHLTGRAFAANSTVWGVMGVAGPGIAAVILSIASWPWIFLVNLPLGTIALATGWRVMPGPLDGAERPSVDYLGIGMVFAFNAMLLLAVDELGPMSAAWLLIASIVATLYLRRARRIAHPVMRMRHLIGAPFGLLAGSVALVVGGGISVHSFFTVYVRGARGAGASLTAWSVMFFVVGWTAGANLSSRLLDRMADTAVMRIGMGVATASLALVATLASSGSSLPALFAVMVTTGAGVGLATNAGLTLLRSLASDTEMGRATAAQQFYRNLGFSLGAAMGGAVMLLVAGRAPGGLDGVRQLLAGSDVGADPVLADAIGRGFATTAVAGTAVAAAAIVPFVRLRRHLAPARREADQQRS